MCGIAGLVGADWADDDFDRLFAAVAHRGPDDAGTGRIGPVRLGMTRLRFRGARAPMPVQVSHAVAAFNGQVFGVRDRQGRYATLPEGMASEIEAVMSDDAPGDERECADGMFACALVSADGGTIRLKTDPYFIKPLFYRHEERGVAFCSEPGPLQRLGGDNALDRGALAELFAFGWPLDDRCVTSGLRAAWNHDLTITGTRLDATAKPRALAPSAVGDVCAELRRLIAQSVRRCASGAGPFGLALSGGLDSSILAWELNAAGVTDLVTISICGMDGDGVEDLAELGLPPGGAWETWRHRTARIRDPRDLLARFEASTRAFAQPSTMSSLPMYHALAEVAAQEGVRALLTGEGVDECFGGYASYSKVSSLASPLDYYRHPQREALVRLLMGPAALRKAQDRFLAAYGGMDDIRPIEQQLRLTRLLLRSDLCLMAQSIEGRVPFLHNGIPELALSLPWDSLVGGGGKRVLRQAYADALGARGAQRKTRFKASDRMLQACLAAPDVQDRMRSALDLVFGGAAVAAALEALARDDGFDADIVCLLLSLTFLIEDGRIDAHVG